MTKHLIYYDKPDGQRRCISGITESDGRKKFQSHYDLTKAYGLTYKEKENAKTILQDCGCKNISVMEVQEVELA